MADDITSVINSVFSDGPSSEPDQPPKPRVRAEVGPAIQAAVDDLRAETVEIRSLVSVTAQSKTKVIFRSTSTGALATAFVNGTTHDGHVAVTGERFFMDGRSDAKENGLYLVPAAGAPVRTTDADAGAEIYRAEFFVDSGTVAAGQIYRNSNATVPTIGVDNLTFIPWAEYDQAALNSKQDAAANLDDWSDTAVTELYDRPAMDEGEYLAIQDDDGVGARFGTGGIFLAGDNESIEVASGWKVGRGDGNGDIIIIDPDTGIAAILGQPNPDPTTDTNTDAAVVGNLFSDERNEYVEGRALAEALRLNSQDMSGFARRAVDAAAAKVLRIGTGQSFMKGSGQAHLMFTTSRLALLAFTGLPAQTVGPDSRCVNVGATYVPFNGGDLTLTDLSEHFIYPTGTDDIYTETEALTGDYAVNASGGTPEAAREIVSWVLRNRWSMRADTTTQSWKTVNMNHAKTDGSIAEVGEGDGLSRMYSLIDVFVSATTGTRLCDLIHMAHGQADEAAGTATYKTDVETFYENIWTNLQLDLSQTDPPAMVMHQVGGPKYGTSAMVCANAQVDTMLDLTGTSANIFLAGADYETPSFYFYDNGEFTGFPSDSIWDNNGHPTLAGNVLLGVRAGVAAHYIQDRQEPYWIPFPYEAYYEGTDFLISVPSKFMPIRVTDMVCGVETVLLDNLGITFESGGGAENPVLWARVVPGYNTLIEGRCVDAIASYTTTKFGKRTGALTQSGFTNIRDSFNLSIPFDLPFDKAQTYFPLEGRDDPALNGLGRFLEDIPGWVGKPDLGNPCARRTITAQPFPS